VKTPGEALGETQVSTKAGVPCWRWRSARCLNSCWVVRLTESEGTSEEPLDITAMVGLAGQLCGVMSLQCSTKSSAIMASKMLGVEPDQIGPEVCDAFGEICNMVVGNFKNKIAGLGERCMLSVPTVITGNNYSLHSVTDSPVLDIRLQFESGRLVIRLQIHN
jgi:CheY-specific phosphatase CheX